MGGGASKYRADELLNVSQMVGVCPWLANKESKIILKADGFECKTVLGKGKFGLVFLSEYKKTSKYVAIKYIPIDQIYSGKHAVRIDQEIQILSLLDHPFIIHYFGCYKTPAAIALIFKYCLGGELFTRIRQKHKMEEEEIKFYGCEIALAIHYLHDTMNIVYRDLKPENILLDCNGHVTICDFGFACLLSSFSQLSDGCGTTMYLAPEIASGYKDSKHGFAVDWWSLGCLLYEMATGSAPFGDTDELNKFEVLNNINGKTVMYPLFMSRGLKIMISGLLQRCI
jgi:serine/threonine protein kinase